MKKFILSAAFVVLLLACSGATTVGMAGVQSVRLLNKNSVYSDLVVVMFIDAATLKYSATRPGVTTQQWSQPITAGEFAMLDQIVEEEDLLAALAVPPKISSDPCNHAGMVVTIASDGITREFPISGASVCDPATNKGLLRLFGYMDSLATRYKPN